MELHQLSGECSQIIEIYERLLICYMGQRNSNPIACSEISNVKQVTVGLVIVCFAISFISLLDTGSDGSDVADDLPPRVYCDLVTTLNSKCVMTNLLEMFRYDEEVIRTTSTQEIIRAVHELDRSPWYGYTQDFSSLLGGVSR